MYKRKPTSMFTRLGQLTVRRRRPVLVLTFLLVVVAGGVGGGIFDRLVNGGFADPGSESARAADVLEDEFGAGAPNVVLLVTATDGDVDAPAVAAVGQELTEELAAYPRADDVVSYWSLGSPPPLRSEDGTEAIVVGRLAGEQDEWQDVADGLAAEFEGERGPVTVAVGGPVEIFNQIGETIESDLAKAESVAVPVTLVLLIVVFGGIVAALLPVGVGMLAVLGAFFVLWLTTLATDVSVFSINLVTAMGLGLAIDYSLFVVSRFREELHEGRTVEDAVVRTVETAGRTVAFSALTVAVSLSALLIFPLFFLRSFAYAGIGVILVAMLASLVSLPALLAVLGPRVDSLRVFRRRDTPPVGTGFWHRVATTVMRRPLVVTVAVVALLIGLGVPFLQAQFGSPDHRVLPEGNPARDVSEALAEDFASAEADAFPVVVRGGVDDTTLEAYATELSTVPGITRVDAATGRYAEGQLLIGPDASTEQFRGQDAAWFSAVPAVEPISEEGEDLVRAVRDLDAPFDEVLVGGMSAQQVDTKKAIFGLAPWAGLWIAVATFVLLFLMFGSILVPLKALVLNTLSLTATFGAMVWIFQEGNGAGLLGFTATGLTDTTTPILMFCIAFGLSMDYEVFLLSRIKEEYDRTGDNEHSVAAGLEHTGRIVTAAALLLSVTFLAFATSGITFIKLFGLGLAMAVLMDATVVRATLVPAFMKLAGDANWWAPAPLKRLQERFGLHEVPPEDRAPSVAGQPVGDGRDGGRVGHEEGVPTVEPAQLGPLDLTEEGLLGGGEGDAVVAAGRDQHG
jgi:RND superfamily putative drug exporter